MSKMAGCLAFSMRFPLLAVILAATLPTGISAENPNENINETNLNTGAVLVDVGAWNRLTPAQRNTLQNGGTVSNFNLGLCNGGGMPITATISSGPAPDAPTPGVINARQPRRWGNSSFFLARQNMNTAGVEYCFEFNMAVDFRMDSREHAWMAGYENVHVTANNAGTPVNLTGSLQGNVQFGVANGSGTPEVQFSANGSPDGGMWWQASSGGQLVTEICVQYYSTSVNDIASVEPFRLAIDAVKCVADDPIFCGGSSPISRWNKLTTMQRNTLDNGDPIHNFHTGFCDETGDAIRFIEMDADPIAGGWSPYLNNLPPRPYGRHSLDNGRSITGSPGNTYCFTLDEARPFRVDSKEHSHFIGGEVINVKAYLGADPVLLSGYLRTATDSIPVAGGPNGINFTGAGNAHGAYWSAGSGDQPVSQICVEYYQLAIGYTLGREPFSIELCADRCLYDDLYACWLNPSGAPGCTGLPQLFITKTMEPVNEFGLNLCEDTSGTMQNPLYEVTITMDNYGGTVKELFLFDDLQSYLAPLYIYNVATQPQIVASTASGPPLLNPNFNGVDQTDIFVPGTGFLSNNQSITVQFTIELSPNTPNGWNSYVNSVYGGGIGNGGYAANDLSGSGAGGWSDPTPVPVLPANVTKVPAQDVTLEATLPNYMSGLQNWLADNGGAEFHVPGCGPVTWTNDYDPANWVFGCGQITGSIDVTFVATNSCGFVFTTCATFTLEDTEGPACVKPQDLTLDCSDPNANSILQNWLDYSGTWTDLSQPVTFTNDFMGLSGQTCTGDPIVVTWTATDACGNESYFSANLTVVDNLPPVLSSVPGDLDLDLCMMVPDPANVTATDGCDLDVEVEFEETQTGTACDYTLTRTWTATDDCGNSVSASQTIHVFDDQPPVFTNVPPDVTAECPDIPAVQDPDVTDCSAVTLEFEEQQIGGACPLPSQIIRTWTATDACGNSTSVTQVVTMTPPNIVSEIIFTFVPPDVTADCDQNPMFGDPVVETTCPAGGLSISFEDVVNSNGDCSQPFSITRTWTAHDACGNLETASQTINTGPDTQAPMFAADTPDTITVDCGDDLYEPVAFDDCGPTILSYEDSGETGDCATGFHFTRTWTATDVCGNSSMFVQDVTTNPDTTAPVFTFVPYDQFFDCDEPIIFPDPIAFDNCSDVTITWQDSIIGTGDCNEVNGVVYGYDIIRTWIATDECGNFSTAVTSAWVLPGFNSGNLIAFSFVPESMTIDCGGDVVFGTPVCHSACGDFTLTYVDVFDENCTTGSTFTRNWTATDECGNETTASQTITLAPDATAPVFTQVPADGQVSCNGGDPVFGTPVVTDNCAEGAAISLDFEDEMVNTGTCDGHFVTRTWTATDPCGNSSYVSQTIFIVDNAAPAFDFVPADETVACGQLIEFGEPLTSDACSGISLTIEDEMQATNCEGSYALVRTWTATDACGNVSQASQTITVADTQAPVFNQTPGELTLECGDPVVFDEMTASDGCSSMTMMYEDEVEINACGSDHIRTWTATDACGNSAQISQTIHVVDNDAPVFITPVQDLSIQCGEPVVFANMEAVDACSNVSVTFEDTVVDNVCGSEHTRIWIATDGCGNSSLILQKITVIDTEAPVFNGMPSQLQMTQAEFSAWEPPLANVTDCHEVEVTMDETSQVTCTEANYNYVYTATDACGNVAEHNLSVALTDVAFDSEMTMPEEMECGNEYEMSVSPVNGLAPFSYSWQILSGDGWTFTSGTDQAVAYIQSGTGAAAVSVQVTDSQGCSVTHEEVIECTFATAVDEVAVSAMQLLPNPVYDELGVRFSAASFGEASFTIYDMLGGRVVYRETSIDAGWNEHRFDVSKLVPGTYLMTVQMGESFTVKRFVKAR